MKSRARVLPSRRRRNGNGGKRPGADRRADAYESLQTRTTKSSSSTEPATSTTRRNRATSASTRTNAAPRACWIFWTRSAAIAPPNSPIARRWRPICSRSSSSAKPWAPGACHDHFEQLPHRNFHDSAWQSVLRPCHWLLPAAGLARRAPGEMTSFLRRSQRPRLPALYHPARSDVARAGGHYPAKLTRTLRLTGAVAYNAFKTTPVITQVGGPVRRTIVVPGESVREGQRCSKSRAPTIPSCAQLPESARCLSRHRQELRAREGFVRAPRHRRTRSAPGRIGPHPGPGGSQRLRASHENPRNQKSGRP